MVHTVCMAKTSKCDWCGTEVLDGDGYRLIQPKRSLGATFDRLEHVIPWLMKKDDWHIWSDVEVPEDAASTSSQTGEDLGENAIYLVHHRDGERISDGFNDKSEVEAWAKAGGRWAK